MGRDIGSGRNIVQPKELKKYSYLQTGSDISGHCPPQGTDHERALKKAGIYRKAEERKNRKKKPITATQTGNDNANP